MRAHLVLKPATDAPRNDVAIPTAETIKQYMAAPETVLQTTEVAKQLGFKVVNSSPLQVTIEGPKVRFEKVFSTRLESSLPTKGPAGAAQDKVTVRETSLGAFWAWAKAPKVPVELKNSVLEIVLPQTTALHR